MFIDYFQLGSLQQAKKKSKESPGPPGHVWKAQKWVEFGQNTPISMTSTQWMQITAAQCWCLEMISDWLNCLSFPVSRKVRPQRDVSLRLSSACVCSIPKAYFLGVYSCRLLILSLYSYCSWTLLNRMCSWCILLTF